MGLDSGASTGWACLDVHPRGTAVYLAHGILTRSARVHELVGLLERHRPALVVVELPAGNLYAGRNPAAVAHLIEAVRIGTELRCAAASWGAEAIECTATQSRALLSGARDDTGVKRAVRLRVSNWPRASSTHARDAAIAALWGVLTPRAKSA